MKKLIAAIVILIGLSVLFAMPAGAAEMTDPLAVKFDATVGSCDEYYESIEWYVICKLSWVYVDWDYQGEPPTVQVPAAEYEAEAAKYCVLSEELLTAIRNYENYNGDPIYDPETNTYTAFFVGGWGGALPARLYAGYVKTGENTYDVYYEKVTYGFLADDLPEGVTEEDIVGSDWPETVEYQGQIYTNGPEGYSYIKSYDKYGYKYGVQLDGDNVLLATRTPYSVGEQPEVFDDITIEDILTYEIVNGEAVITDCDDTVTGSITIPDTLGGYPVTAIGEFAFAHLTNPLSVNTGNAVTTISDAAFLGCTGLEHITLGDGVSSIGSLAFEACDNLRSFAVSASNPNYTSIDDVLFNKNATVLVCAPKTISGTYTVPAGVLTVGEYAFDGCMYLTDLIISDNVATISNRAFNNCMNLSTVKLGSSVATIGNYAFSNCSRINKLVVPVSVTNIKDYAFYRCTGLADVHYVGTESQWIDINIGSNNETLDAATMHYESDGSAPPDPWYLNYEIIDGGAVIIACDTSIEGNLELPATLGGCPVTEIAMNAFRFSQITDITLPETLTTIRGNAFCFSSLRGIYIPASVHTIDPVAFQGCGNFYGFVVDPNNPYFSNDGYGVLFNKPMTELIMAPGALLGTYTIPDGVTTVDYAAFFYCNQLVELNIPASVTNMDWNTGIFKDCNNLRNITVDPENPSYYSDGSSVIYNEEKTRIYYAPKTLTGTYCVPDGVISVNDAFEYCADLEGIIFPESLTSIDSQFYGCNRLKKIYIPQSAFIFNFNLHPLEEAQAKVIYGGTIEQWDAIYMLDSNKHPENLNVLYSCTQDVFYLSWYIHESSIYISDCDESATGSITIPDTLDGYPVVGIDPWAFQSCTGITEIHLPDSVTYMGINAFGYCSSLTKVTMSSNVTVIGQGAFIGCSSLTDVYYSGSPMQWNSIGIETENECLTGATLHCAINCDNGHTWETTVTKATLSEDGLIVKNCKVCGSSETTVIPRVDAFSLPGHILIADGTQKRPVPIVWDCEGNALTEGIDYTVTYPANAIEAGDYELLITLTGNYSGERILHYIIEPALEITKQPTTQKVKAGATVKFSVGTIGFGVDYQWQSSTNGKTWKNCSSSSAAKATFSFTSKTSHSSNYYRCKVTDYEGNVLYTNAVRLYVLGITTQPKTQKVEAGEKVTFTVAASGAGKTYQWQSSTDGKTWKNCSSSSAIKATFTFTSKTSHNGNYYRCRIKDNAGNTVYTDAVRLYVLGITSQPKTQKVKTGATVKFTVKATGTGLKYQWQSSADGKTWKNCSSTSATKATFSFTGKTSHNGNYYRCKVTDSAGNVVYTSTVRLYVLGITEQPVSKTVTKGKTAKFTVEATGSGLKYQWQCSTDGGKTWKNCSSTSAKKATFTFTSKTTHNSNYYRCRVTDSAGNVIYSGKVKLTVKK